MKTYLSILSVFLIGCSGISTQKQQIEVACASTAAATKVLTVANDSGKLTESQQDQVLKALSVTTPICAASAVPTLDDIKSVAFMRAVDMLRIRAAIVEGNAQ